MNGTRIALLLILLIGSSSLVRSSSSGRKKKDKGLVDAILVGTYQGIERYCLHQDQATQDEWNEYPPSQGYLLKQVELQNVDDLAPDQMRLHNKTNTVYYFAGSTNYRQGYIASFHQTTTDQAQDSEEKLWTASYSTVNSPQSIAVDQQRDVVYWSDLLNIYQYDINRRTITIAVGESARWIVLDEDTNRMYLYREETEEMKVCELNQLLNHDSPFIQSCQTLFSVSSEWLVRGLAHYQNRLYWIRHREGDLDAEIVWTDLNNNQTQLFYKLKYIPYKSKEFSQRASPSDLQIINGYLYYSCKVGCAADLGKFDLSASTLANQRIPVSAMDVGNAPRTLAFGGTLKGYVCSSASGISGSFSWLALLVLISYFVVK